MTYANWPNLVLQVKDKATNLKHTQGYSIEVKFLPGDLFILQSKEVLFANRITPDGPSMGRSIGISGERNAGTLGGYVMLKQNSNVHKGFLTTYQAEVFRSTTCD